MNTHELAWAAGFFDGEGCFQFNIEPIKKGRNVTSRRIGCRINQISDIPLVRFQAAIACGQVAQYGFTTTGKPFYSFTTGSFENVQAIIAKLWKYLSKPKREQAISVLRKYHQFPLRRTA